MSNEWDTDDAGAPLLWEEALQEVQAGVDSLPEELLDLYMLWNTGEYSLDELAKEFETTLGQIRARVHRIKLHFHRTVSIEALRLVGFLDLADFGPINRFGTFEEQLK